MDAKQRLYFALGQFLCAVAKADRLLQPEEKDMLHQIIEEERIASGMNAEFAEVIFELLARNEQIPMERCYHWALQELHWVRHLLTPELKQHFAQLLERIALASDPITPEEGVLIQRFRTDLTNL